MALETAEWPAVLFVLHETFKIWSAGLTRSHYCFYTWRQLKHPWARKNFRFMVYRSGENIVAGLKIYSMSISLRGSTYRLAGLGAVYSMESHRAQGYGGKLMTDAVDLARREGFDGVYLFSDIGSSFYERFGFQVIAAHDFILHVPAVTGDRRNEPEPDRTGTAGALYTDVCRVELSHIPALERPYARWLRRQPYGVDRSTEYWNYKLWRENFLHKFSSLTWPGLELICESVDRPGGGYAIIECAGRALRVLEVVGSAGTQRAIWLKLVETARRRGCTLIRGWESLRPDLPGAADLNERSWGLPMMLPFRKELDILLEVNPCHFLELDHL